MPCLRSIDRRDRVEFGIDFTQQRLYRWEHDRVPLLVTALCSASTSGGARSPLPALAKRSSNVN